MGVYELNRLSWEAGIDYYYPKYNLLFAININKFINHDHGLTFKCTRYFKETAIGFYGQINENQNNGGFYFSIPLPGKKRRTNKKFSISIPRYFEWTYNAATEFYYGQNYDSKPDQNNIEYWYNPNYFNEYLKTR